jgi:hypothetical protein
VPRERELLYLPGYARAGLQRSNGCAPTTKDTSHRRPGNPLAFRTTHAAGIGEPLAAPLL